MTLTQILQKIKSVFYTKTETDSKLSTKANDSDVVHKSGYEAIGGNKRILDTLNFYADGDSRQYDVFANAAGSASTLNLCGPDSSKNITVGYRNGATYVPCSILACNGDIRPIITDTCNLGYPQYKWKDVNTTLLNGKTPAYASDLSSYLPLSGGIMTSYNVMGRNVTNSHLQIAGGTSDRDGAFLSLAGKDFSPRPGAFFMVARTDGNNFSWFQGTPDGALTWNGKNIDVIEEQGDGYIRYSNGLQICRGTFSGLTTDNKSIIFQKPFSSGYAEDLTISVMGQNGSNVISLVGWTDTSFIVRMSGSGIGLFMWQAIGKWK